MEAKYFCSLTRKMIELTKLAPFFIAVSLTSSSRSTFSLIGTSKASFTIGAFQVTSPTPSTGASFTGSALILALALAIATAWRAAAARLSAVTVEVAAKPHVPPASTRMPVP